MTSIDGVHERLARACGLPELLDAAYDAFEDMLTVIRQHDEPDGEWFIPMVVAAASAANGRDAVGWAPSLPARRLHPEQAEGNAVQPVTAQVAASWVAGLCEVLAGSRPPPDLPPSRVTGLPARTRPGMRGRFMR